MPEIIEESGLLNEEAYDQSFWAHVRRQLMTNTMALISLLFIAYLAFIALFADFIANEKPLMAKYKGKTYFPVLRQYLVDLELSQWPKDFQNAQWKDIEFDYAIWPVIPYLPKNIDFDNAQYVGPTDRQVLRSNKWRHWLGTDELGHDILAGMIHATRIALSVGLVSVGISSFMGILLGAMAGYFGDDRLKISRIRLILNIIFIVFGIFYAFGTRSYLLSDALGESPIDFFGELFTSLMIFSVFLVIANALASVLKKVSSKFKKKISLPIDIIISRVMEIILSVPQLLLILTIVAIARPSIFIVMAVIGLTSWVGTARFIRGELLRVRNLEYIEAAQALGYSEARTLFKHAIPNSLSPVLITAAFGVAAAILVESSLSFLGIGVPAEVMTWGSILSAARQAPSAWWLAIFPGFAIFLTVTAFNLLGEGLTDALDPRLKQ